MTESLSPLPENSRVAVVGAGVAGLTAAWLIAQRHRVDLLEQNDCLGGHTCTLTVPEGPDEGTPVDAGFIVMNHRNYPLLTRLFERLDVDLGDSDMSFGFRCEASGYAYAGSSLRALFAQRRNILNAGHWKMLGDIIRFNRDAFRDLNAGALSAWTLGEYVDRGRYGRGFQDHYLMAMGSAIWSSPSQKIREFPAQSFVHFFKNHGLLELRNRPQWRYVRKGSQSYVKRMMDRFSGTVRTSQNIRSIERSPQGVRIHFLEGETKDYDYVVLGAHADEALALLDHPLPQEKKLLGAWSYQENNAVFHSDESIMPRHRHAWASWNFLRSARTDAAGPVSVTYHMNRLQNLETVLPYFVSLNVEQDLDPSCVWAERSFFHPVYDFKALETQADLPKLNGSNRTWFCGSYFGYGFHEDAVRSAVRVAEDFGVSL